MSELGHAVASSSAKADPGYDQFRATVYGLLGSLLSSPPTQAMLDWLRELELSPGTGSPMAQAWSELQHAACEAKIDDVADEYQDLFIGLGTGEVVPYSSWYKTGFLMETPLASVRRDLQALGIEREDEVREPEDHIAALCQVMAMLVDARNGYPPGQQGQFFRDHLADWYERFFNDLKGCRSAKFYRGVGSFGAAFLNQEGYYLEA